MSGAKKSIVKEDITSPGDSGDDFQNEEASLEEDWSLTEGEEDLEATVEPTAVAAAARPEATSSSEHPVSVDDYLRSFLCQMGMTQTLDCFQSEWAEMAQKGEVDVGLVGVVPDFYIQNQRLSSELKKTQREKEEYRRLSSAAAETTRRVQRERDVHRMKYTRVVQEKNRLIEEMRKLKVQCDHYEHAQKRINETYQAALRGRPRK